MDTAVIAGTTRIPSGGQRHGCRRNRPLVLALVVALGISLAFQASLVGEFGSDSETTPDSLEYIRLAKRIGAFLGDPSVGVGDDLRPPSYALLLNAAAKLAGVEPSEASIELRNWGGRIRKGARSSRRRS